MRQPRTAGSLKMLPLVLAVTTMVAIAPIGLVWELRSTGAITSGWVAVAVAAAMSLAMSLAARVYWSRRPHEGDLLFSELFLWGWLSRSMSRRRLVNAVHVLGVFDHDAAKDLSPERRRQLLAQLANALDAQDTYLDGHSRRVARYSEKIARRMGLSRQEAARIRAAAAVHDVGKLHVSKEVLDKPGALTDDEFAIIRRHSLGGAEMVEPVGDDELTSIVRHHHERLDGRGYPDALKGEQIPLGARIVAVADTFDAITSPRPYRPAARHRVAIDTLREAAGTQLDPDAVKAFLSCYAGRRHVLLSALLAEMPQQAAARVVGLGGPFGAFSSGNALATAAAAAAIGAAAAPASVAAPTGNPASRSLRAAFMISPSAPFEPVSFTGSPFLASPDSRHTPAHSVSAARRVRRRGSRPRPHRRHGGVRDAGPATASKAATDGSGRAGSTTASGVGTSTAGSWSGTNPGRSRQTSTGKHANPGSHGFQTAAGRGHGSPAGSAHGTHQAGANGRPAHWTPPGKTGQPAPGRSPTGSPGQTGSTPGQSGAPSPGLRGQTPPGQGNESRTGSGQVAR